MIYMYMRGQIHEIDKKAYIKRDRGKNKYVDQKTDMRQKVFVFVYEIYDLF